MHVLRYNLSNDVADMEKAAEQLAESLEHYRTLAELTKGRYQFANSMQTSQRQIPVPAPSMPGRRIFTGRSSCSVYEKELADFEQSVRQLKADSALPPTGSAP